MASERAAPVELAALRARRPFAEPIVWSGTGLLVRSAGTPAARAPAMRALALAVGTVLAIWGCGAAPREAAPVAWPPRRDPAAPIARHPLAERPATRQDQGLARLPSTIAPRHAAVIEPAPRWIEPAPGVRAREGEAEGLGYLEVVLGDVSPETALPLVVVIHGRGDRPRVPGGPFEGLTRPVRVMMPRGPMIVGHGFGWLPVVVGDHQPELLSAGLREVGDRLARWIARVRAERPCVGPTILSGFSQGGMLALTIAVRHPEAAGVVFPLAGWLPPPLWPSEPAPRAAPPIRAMHARDDDRIPYEPSRESYEHLRSLGWDLELSTYEGVGHAMSAEMDAAFHGWLERALEAIATGAPSLVQAPSVPTEPEPEIQPEERPRPRARRSRRRGSRVRRPLRPRRRP